MLVFDEKKYAEEIINNKKYIEITDEWFIHFEPKERDEYFEKSKKLKEWLRDDR